MSEINQDENVMERLTTEFAEYICDKLCKEPLKAKNQEELEEVCCECSLGSFICNICNEYNRINDFEKSQLYILLEKNARLRKGYEDIVERLVEEAEEYRNNENWALRDRAIKVGTMLTAKDIVKEVGGMNE